MFLFLKAFLSLLFVIGLLFLTLWALKSLQNNDCKHKIFKKLAKPRRINLIEYRRIDAKNSVAIIKVDEVEQTILLGVNQNMVLKENSK